MKILFLLGLLLTACATKNVSIVLPNDEDYLVGLELLRTKKLAEATPLLDKSCKSGLQAACLAIGNVVDREMLDGLSILQGATDEKTTQINIVIPKGEGVYPIIWNELKMLSDKSYQFEVIERSYSDFAIMKVYVGNLKKGQNYRIDLLTESSKLLDYRYFEVFDNSVPSLKFLVASCMSDEYPELQAKIWPEAVTQDADVLFLIGDNVYADRVNGMGVKEGVGEMTLWQRYVDHRRQLAIYQIEKLVPVYAVWDDHDYGLNNGGKYFAHKADSQTVFNTFWSQSENTFLKKGKGIGFYLSLRGHHFYFLDNRSFRDPAEDRLGSHFGKDQELWLYQYLKKNKNFNWIISGDQFFGSHHPWESYEGLHPNQFKEFLTNLKRSKSKVFLISGDRHLTELMSVKREEIGSDTYELTSSGIHAKYFPNTIKEYGSKRMIEGAGGMSNYVVIDSMAGSPVWNLKVQALSVGEKLLYQRELVVD